MIFSLLHASTLVETTEGLKPIEEIREGDLVLAYDEQTGEQAYKPVVQLFRNETTEWYHIRAGAEEIICTGGHPFYVLNAAADRRKVNYEGCPENAKGTWICADELRSGDELLLADGTIVAIEAVTAEKLSEPETTYNFEVADSHTYYVSELNVLVHNDCRGKNKLKPDPDAKGPHTTYKRDPVSKKITNYATYKPNPLNPSGFDEVLRFDGVGASHGGIPTPHVHIGGNVRPAFPWEIPL